MKVEMKDLRESQVDLQIDCTPEALELQDPEFSFPERVGGAVLFSLAGDKVLARGRLETTIEADCVRCLKKVRATLRAPVDVVYEIRKEAPTPELEVFGPGEDDERVAFFDGETIRPEPQLREALLIELPSLPVCDAACKGLCPRCGADLNEGVCGCELKGDEEPDWKSALKKMKLD